MADLNLGRTRSSANGSQDATLRSIKQAVEQFQFKGQKLDANAVNQILQAIAKSQENAGQYQFDLTSANNNTIVEKLKDVIKKLYDQQAADAEKQKTATEPQLTAEDIQNVVVAAVEELKSDDAKVGAEEQPTVQDNSLEQKLDAIDEVLKSEASSKTSDDQNKTEQASVVDSPIADVRSIEIAKTQEYIKDQLDQINSQLGAISQSVSTLSLIGFETSLGRLLKSFGKSLLSSLASPFVKISNVVSGISHKIISAVMSPFKNVTKLISGITAKAFSAIASPFKLVSSGISSLASSISNGFKAVKAGVGKALSATAKLAMAPFKAIGSLFSMLNPFKSRSDTFTFEKLNKFLVQFFNAKKVTKWLSKSMKSFAKVLKNYVKVIINPIKEMLFDVVDKVSDIVDAAINKVLIAFFPVIAAIWVIFAAVVLLVLGIIWIFKNLKTIGKALMKFGLWIWDKIKAFGEWIWDKIKAFGEWIWDGLKSVGEWIWSGIRYVFYDMWIELGEWIAEKAKQLFQWVSKKITAVWNTLTGIWDKITDFGKTIKEALVAWWNESSFKKNYDQHIKPFVDSLTNLQNRIKSVWDSFQWNENMSFLENLGQLWTNIKNEIKQWWNSSPIKTAYENLKSWLSDKIKILRDWWNESDLKKTITGIFDFIKNLPGMIWDKIKEFFGAAGDAVDWTVNKAKQLGHAVADTVGETYDKITGFAKGLFTDEEVVQETEAERTARLLQEEREKLFEVDKGTVLDIFDYVKRIFEIVSAPHEESYVAADAVQSTAVTDITVQPISDIQVQDIESTLVENATEVTSEADNTADKEILGKLDMMARFMTTFAKTSQLNFEALCEKLDQKPNLLPFPMMNPIDSNMTALENR